MSLDHAQTLRLGQKGVAPTPGVQLVTEASLPEVAYRGQIVYALDLDEFRVYDGDAWQVPTAAVAAGTQTFVGPTEPVADAVGDMWMKNTTYQLYVWDGAVWQEVQDPAAQAAADAASSAMDKALEALGAANHAQDIADGKIDTFYTPLAPAPPDYSPATGDLWFRTTDNRAFIYDSTSATPWVEIQDKSITQALEDAGTAQSTADQKISTYYLGNPPWPDGSAGHGNDIGDLWFDISDNNKCYRWNGSWIPVRDGTIAVAQAAATAAQGAADTALSKAQTAQTTADGKAVAYFQIAQPTGQVAADVGDLWFDTDDGNKMYRWTGTTWVVAQDQQIATAINNAAAANTAAGVAKTTADSKITTFYQTAAPSGTGRTIGDLWVDTDAGNQLFRWDGTNWITVRDTTIATAQNAAVAAQGTASSALANAQTAQTTADGKAVAYFQTAQPTGQVAGDVGDLWFDTDDGNKMWRWSGSAWVVAQDQQITTAINNAAAANTAAGVAKTTADSKITTFYQDAQPVALAIGDLWVETDASNLLWRWNGTAWISVRDGTIAIAQAAAVAAQSSANGKNKIYRQAGQPPPGALGDTWFDTDDDNRIYVWDGSTWAASQLGQNAIKDLAITNAKVANLDAGKMTTGTMQAQVTLSGSISTRTSGTGPGTDINPTGIAVYDTNGAPAITLQPEDSSFKGDAEIAGLTVTGGMSLRSGGVHEISRAAALTLQLGSTAPQSAPMVIVDWTSIDVFSSHYGLAYNSGWSVATDTTTPGIYTYPMAGGTSVSSGPINALSDYRPWGGLTKIGTDWFFLSKLDGGTGYTIHRIDSTYALVSSAAYASIAGDNGSGGDVSQGLAPASIGTDGTNILIAEYDTVNNRFRIQVRSPSTLAVTSTVNTNSATGFAGPVTGIMGGNFDFGSFRYLISTLTQGYVWAFTSAGTYQASESYLAPASNVRGIGWDGASLYTSANGRVYKHTSITLPGVAGPLQAWYAVTTWYDSDPAGTGQHETTISPLASFSMKRRARLTIGTNTVPDQGGSDDPDSFRTYLSNTTTALSALWLQTAGTLNVSGTASVFTSGVAFSGSNPPPINTFPDSVAGKIRNPNDTLSVSGDGSIQGTSVTVSGVPVATTTDVQTLTNKTLSAPNFTGASKFGAVGSNVSVLRHGTVSLVPNASGLTNVTHGCGVTPTSIFVTSTAFYGRITTQNATTFTVEWRVPPALGLATTQITFFWLAIV